MAHPVLIYGRHYLGLFRWWHFLSYVRGLWSYTYSVFRKIHTYALTYSILAYAYPRAVLHRIVQTYKQYIFVVPFRDIRLKRNTLPRSDKLKVKVKVWTLVIAPLTWVRLVTSSALQSRKWQLIGMSQWCGVVRWRTVLSYQKKWRISGESLLYRFLAVICHRAELRGCYSADLPSTNTRARRSGDELIQAWRDRCACMQRCGASCDALNVTPWEPTCGL